MKAFYICLSLCLAAAAGFAADDPYEAAFLTLPQQHSHGSSPVAPLTLAEAEQIALQANPQVRLAVRKVSMAEAHISGAGALDDPALMYRGWQVPLSQPWNYNAAMNMFMIGQSFPGPGKRALRTEIAGGAVTVAKAELEATKRNILAQLREAYYDILRTGDELQVHDEQAAIARQALEAAHIKYEVGKVPQQDVLKAQVALTKLIEHLVMLEQDGELARASLNTLAWPQSRLASGCNRAIQSRGAASSDSGATTACLGQSARACRRSCIDQAVGSRTGPRPEAIHARFFCQRRLHAHAEWVSIPQ